jgi:drug/metabolite transporter (DMT)-like permease
MGSRQYGIILVTVSTVLWSTAGLFVRMAGDLDTWTLVGWRSLFALLTLGAFVVYQHRSRLLQAAVQIGRPGLFNATLAAISTIGYVLSLQLTTVAIVMTVFAILPFVASFIAFFWIKERPTVHLFIAGAIAFAGIVIMSGAAVSRQDVIGIVVAFVMTAAYAAQLVHAKLHPKLDMTIVSALAAAACGLVALPFMQAAMPSPMQLLACALFGMLTTGLAYILILIGVRYVTSGEAGFISLLDVVLGPLWVWYFFAEEPTLPVLIGGSIVLAAVVWYLSTNRAGDAVRAHG